MDYQATNKGQGGGKLKEHGLNQSVENVKDGFGEFIAA